MEEKRACPSLLESFLSRHPISDQLRRSLAAEITLLGKALSNRYEHLLNGGRVPGGHQRLECRQFGEQRGRS